MVRAKPKRKSSTAKRPIRARVTRPDKDVGQASGGGWEEARFEAALWQFGLLGQYKDEIYVNQYTAFTYAVIWRCVNYIANTIASLGWHVYDSAPGSPDKTRIYDDVWWMLDMQPNMEMNAADWRRVMLKDALTNKGGFSEIDRDGFGRPRLLHYIAPDRVELKRDEGGQLYYKIDNGIGEPPGIIPPENMFCLKGLSPDGLVGYNTVALARGSIRLGLQTERYGENYFNHGPMPGGILKLPGNPKEEDRKRAGDTFMKAYGGSKNAGRVPVMSGGVEFTPLNIQNDNAQFIESRKFQIIEQCRWFGVPPHKVFDLERATFCLPAGENILTLTGPRPIEDIRNGDMVWSRGPEGLKVARVIRHGRTGTDPILTIRTTNRTLRCNAKHPILCRRRKLTEKVGAVIGGVYEGGRLHSVDWVTEYVPAGELRVGDTVVVLDRLPGTGSLDILPSRVPTIGFMEFCGLLVGDGNVIRNAESSSAYVTIARAKHAAYMDYYREVMQAEFRGRGSKPIRLQEGERQTRFSSVLAVEELTALGLCGNARTKRVPCWVFALPESHRLAFVRGFLDADGSCDKKGRLSFSSCNRVLLGQVRDLCIGCGIPVTNLRCQRGTTMLPNGQRKEFVQYGFTCSDPGANRRIGSRTPTYVARMEAGQPFGRKGRAYPRHGGPAFGERGLSLARIASINVGPAEPVYDLAVEGTHSFIAEGVVVHNSNIEHQSIEAVQDCHLPWCTSLEAEANLKLFGRVNRGRRWTKLNLKTLLRGDSKTQTENLTSQVNSGITMVDEAREYLDMNPLPNGLGKVPLIQGAMKSIEQVINPPEPPQPAVTPKQDGQQPAQDGQDSTQPAPEPAQASADPAQLAAVFGTLLADVYGQLLRVETDKAKRAENKGELGKHAAGYYTPEGERSVAERIRPVIEGLLIAAGRSLEDAGKLAATLAADHNRRSVQDLKGRVWSQEWANGRAAAQAREHIGLLREAFRGTDSRHVRTR